MPTVYLLEATPKLGDGSTTVPVRLAGGGSPGRPYSGYRGFTDWRSGIMTRPRFSSALGFDASGWTGGAIPQTASIVFGSASQDLLDQLAGYFWAKARVTLRSGNDDFGEPTFGIDMVGTVAGISFAGGKLTLTVSDLSGDLAKPVVQDTFSGLGGIEGIPEASGRIKRRTLGKRFNVEGRLLDSANNIYEFGDPNRPLEEFVEVRDKGVAGFKVVLPWAGTAIATFNALAASTPAEGGGVFAPSIACVKWWTQPAGPLTADIRGENTGGYVDKAGDIAARLCAIYSDITLADVAAVNALKTAEVGLHFADATETVASALDRLFLPLTLIWKLLPSGLIEVREWTWTGPVETLRSETVARQEVYAPLRTRSLGYQKNERIQATSELAVIDASFLIFRQDDPPTTASEGDEWIDTNDGNRLYLHGGLGLFYNGVEVTYGGVRIDMPWIDISDLRADSALTAAEAALATAAIAQEAADNAAAIADGKIDSFYQTSAPAGSEGDIWFDTDDGNKQYRYTSGAWTLARDAGIGNAITAAAGAQATADGKVTTFYSTSTPTATAVGDLWYNSANGLLKRWSGSAWVDAGSLGAPAGTSVSGTPAVDVGSTVKTGGGVADNNVSTPAIVAYGVTKAYYQQLASPIATTYNTYVNIFSLTMTKDIAGSTVKLQAALRVYSLSANVNYQIAVYRDGTIIYQDSTTYSNDDYAVQTTHFLQFFDTGASVGSHLYEISVSRNLPTAPSAHEEINTNSNFLVEEQKR